VANGVFRASLRECRAFEYRQVKKGLYPVRYRCAQIFLSFPAAGGILHANIPSRGELAF